MESPDHSPQPSAARPESWIDEHGDCLYRYALARVRRAEVAEDLVQETLLAAVRAPEGFAGRASERSWLVGILKNKVCDYFRKLGREMSFTDLAFFSDECANKFEDDLWIHERGPVEWKPEASEALERAEFWSALHSCLGKLPERIAAVFTMREMDDTPAREVCAALGITDANLWVMLHRARMALRQCLEMNYFAAR